MTLRLPVRLAVAASLLLSPLQALAATDYFQFNWSGYDGDENLITAEGSLGIVYDDLTGAFDYTDLFDIEIIVDGGVFGTFVIDDWTAGSGVVSGNKAFFNAASEPSFDSFSSTSTELTGDYFLGCVNIDCGASEHLILISFAGEYRYVSYSSAEEAAQSFVMNMVPLPAALPMTLAGAGALAWAGRRRRG